MPTHLKQKRERQKASIAEITPPTKKPIQNGSPYVVQTTAMAYPDTPLKSCWPGRSCRVTCHEVPISAMAT